jgi:arabinose-5-phosphate isomerase
MDADAIKRLAVAIIETEAAAVNTLAERVDDAFTQACQLMLDCTGPSSSTRPKPATVTSA